MTGLTIFGLILMTAGAIMIWRAIRKPANNLKMPPGFDDSHHESDMAQLGFIAFILGSGLAFGLLVAIIVIVLAAILAAIYSD